MKRILHLEQHGICYDVTKIEFLTHSITAFLGPEIPKHKIKRRNIKSKIKNYAFIKMCVCAHMEVY